MSQTIFDMGKCDIAWCPGCGNFGILNIIKDVLAELSLPQQEVVFVSGIGQAAKIPQYMKVHYFNGLHGRALPTATAIKASNPCLTVIAQSGDGDMYGEGGNHFTHCIRRNPNITNIVHNNMVYGLTKGQASPTSERGFHTPIQINGVILEPFNPIASAIALDASFVARVSVGEKDHAKDIIKKAITHKGYALVDFFQPCVTFNKVNTHMWFKENTYLLDDAHDVSSRVKAFEKAIEKDKLPLGIFYIKKDKPVFEEQLTIYKSDKRPLFERTTDFNKLNELINNFKN
ncbi:MAG: 2-oxoacid ferredoxin oxidoreductase [Candidatus Omnitrophica bacterium]|nr:2-oxoacid ferredoxin oxidoreductase [Candidatus Omnitrophota bacterium]